MKRKGFFLAKGFLLASVAFLVICWVAQPYAYQWEETFGGIGWDYGHSVQQTTDGGYIIAGETDSFGAGSRDVYLIKTDANGNELWSNTFGGIGWDCAYSVQQTTDGGYIITGETLSFGAGSVDVYLIKTDANGDELWSKTFGGTNEDWGRSVRQTTDGGYIIAGDGCSFGAGRADVYLIKTDANGDELWSNTFGENDRNWGESVQQTTDGGYIIVGETFSFGTGSYDVYLVKTDANGDELWSNTFEGTDRDLGHSVQQTTDGGYIIAGGTGPEGMGRGDVYLIKTDANGEELWSKTFGGTDGDWGRSVRQTSDGGYIIAGGAKSFGAGGGDVYLIYYNPQPFPDIKANDSDGPLFVTPSDTANVSVSLDPGDMAGENCDWWIGALTPFGTYWVNPSLSWIRSDTPISVDQYVLFNLSEESLLNRPLPVGIYTFFFALDDTPDGVFDLTWYDYVDVICQPEAAWTEALPDFEALFQEKMKELMRE
jgi:outer membrane protein assembly factor BamB